MIVKEYGLAKCVGEENLANAIQHRASEGYHLHSIVFTGVVQVMKEGAILQPNEPPPTLSSYLAIFEITHEVTGVDA